MNDVHIPISIVVQAIAKVLIGELTFKSVMSGLILKISGRLFHSFIALGMNEFLYFSVGHSDTIFVTIAKIEANIWALHEFPAAILKICINYANEARSHLCLWIKLFIL